MGTGGFAHCAECREFLWVVDDGLCAVCADHAAAVEEPMVEPEPTVEQTVEPEPEPDPAGTTRKHGKSDEPGRAAKDVRKRVARQYEKGKLGAKPKRAQLAGLARKLWDERSADGRDRLTADLRELGFTQKDPFEALLDLCEVTVLKTKSSTGKKPRKAKVKVGGQSVRTVSGGLPGQSRR